MKQPVFQAFEPNNAHRTFIENKKYFCIFCTITIRKVYHVFFENIFLFLSFRLTKTVLVFTIIYRKGVRTMCTRNQLNEILSKISQTAKSALKDKLDSIILYGSYARGDYDKDSDIDILILADIPREHIFKYKSDLIRLSSELGLEYDIVITVTLKDTETFYKYINAVPFYQNIKKEGVPVAV